jgi:hypothetical protein
MTKRGAAEQWILNGTSQLQKVPGRRHNPPHGRILPFPRSPANHDGAFE